MATNIKPTVGRIVWYWPGARSAQPCAAIIAHVLDDRYVNLAVFDNHGRNFADVSIPLIQEGEEDPPGAFCEWMPCQKGQAAKHDAAVKFPYDQQSGADVNAR